MKTLYKPNYDTVIIEPVDNKISKTLDLGVKTTSHKIAKVVAVGPVRNGLPMFMIGDTVAYNPNKVRATELVSDEGDVLLSVHADLIECKVITVD